MGNGHGPNTGDNSRRFKEHTSRLGDRKQSSDGGAAQIARSIERCGLAKSPAAARAKGQACMCITRGVFIAVENSSACGMAAATKSMMLAIGASAGCVAAAPVAWRLVVESGEAALVRRAPPNRAAAARAAFEVLALELVFVRDLLPALFLPPSMLRLLLSLLRRSLDPLPSSASRSMLALPILMLVRSSLGCGKRSSDGISAAAFGKSLSF